MADPCEPIVKKENEAEKTPYGLSDLELESEEETTAWFGRPGSQLSDKLPFTNKHGQTIWAYPIIVDLRRLVQLGQISEQSGVIPGVSNRDLLHAVVGLYDVSLTDMTTDILYSTVCEKWARTIVLIRDIKDTIQDLEERKKKKQGKGDGDKTGDGDSTDESVGEADVPEEDFLAEDEGLPSLFDDVYSDSESEEELEEDEEEEEESEEDFSKGINAFIKMVKARRKERNALQGEITAKDVGIESQLMACVTFEKKYVCSNKEHVIHLTFISVRKRARKFQMGRYLLSKCLDVAVVGHYDAVVVHADNSAVEFFSKFGFLDDLILNSKWRELAEQFTDCTLMCYLPGISGSGIIEIDKDFEMSEIETEFKKWQAKSLEAYQSQVSCLTRMRYEIMQLKSLAKKQSDFVMKLMEENEDVRRGKLKTERELLSYRLETAQTAFKSLVDSNFQHMEHGGNGDDDINTSELIEDLEHQVRLLDSRLQETEDKSAEMDLQMSSLLSSSGNGDSKQAGHDQPEPVERDLLLPGLSSISAQFKKAMAMDLSVKMQYEVTSITKATLSASCLENFNAKIQTLADPNMRTELYFCGTLEKPHRCKQILGAGFSQEDFSYGDYGHGLYFSKHPSKAAQFSALGKLLVVEVGLGAVETVTKADRTRKAPAKGMDSIITPGRLYKGDVEAHDGLLCQEYIVFNVHQVLPICLITYHTVKQ